MKQQKGRIDVLFANAGLWELTPLEESMTIIKNSTDNLRFSFPLMKNKTEVIHKENLEAVHRLFYYLLHYRLRE